jgi:uncharacterized XkdX family phage protein
MIEKIKRYYLLGIYKEKHIKKLLDAGAITETQYKEILGE